MNFKVNDIVKIVSVDAFYYNALGRVAEVNDDEVYVVFEMIDSDTGEVSVYEDCYYYDYEVELYEGGE